MVFSIPLLSGMFYLYGYYVLSLMIEISYDLPDTHECSMYPIFEMFGKTSSETELSTVGRTS